jgi:hypothetical protein
MAPAGRRRKQREIGPLRLLDRERLRKWRRVMRSAAICLASPHVRFWHKADVPTHLINVCFWG